MHRGLENALTGPTPDKSARRRRWTHGLIDLLVIASCGLVFFAVVAGSKATTPRRPPVEEWNRAAGLSPAELHHSAAHDLRSGGFGPWTPARPR
jgi:hypothetical protein